MGTSPGSETWKKEGFDNVSQVQYELKMYAEN